MGQPGPSEEPFPGLGAARPGPPATTELDDFFMIWGSITQPAAQSSGDHALAESVFHALLTVVRRWSMKERLKKRNGPDGQRSVNRVCIC
jgi:hypothetical protein